ncbi:unnamed protein product [Linum trigynum]|uniref:Uncharacterized protein n=1 Tax=Linum trigynum TaxID=586398 RepID=A0AAV2EH55_9ROSI
MKQTDKKKTPNFYEAKRPGMTETKARFRPKERESKVLHAFKPVPRAVVSDSNVGSEASEVYENLVIHYVDDVNRCEDSAIKDSTLLSKENTGEVLADHSNDTERDQKLGKQKESDSETIKDSVSSHGGDSVVGDDEKVESVSRAPKTVGGTRKRTSVVRDTEACKLRAKSVTNTPRKPAVSSKEPSTVTSKNASVQKIDVKEVKLVPKPPSETSEGGVEDMIIDDGKEPDVFEEASNATTRSIASDNDTVEAEENSEHGEDATLQNQRIAEMETKVEKLEEELREVAVLEISLYSVVPEHGSSAHKVHTPARRLSRLYIHAGKHWTLDKRATIAKNTVSGLVLISKSCGTDVPRLSFWLSNTIVLRNIISQAFGCSGNSSMSRFTRSNESMEKGEGKCPSLKWKGGSQQGNGYPHFVEDWQETGTFIAALEKVESWVFSRIVESVWWQALAPHMQAPSKKLLSSKSSSRLLGPALGDQQQGDFSINLWKKAFEEAFRRICPVRAGGHECGCLPVVAKMVMEQCVARLDVAMFNAILRESANEIPTDPVSDPILDSRVLPIPAGELSFGSGAQLKNSVGNWFRWLVDTVAMDDEETPKQDEETSSEVDDDHRQDAKPKCFNLLNDLSDLLMLPKDLLIDRSVRQEVCPSIDLPLVKRILCNFTPDEFCPDAVPGAVLEALNAGSLVERKLLGQPPRSFPYSAAPVVYTPPSSDAVSEKVAEVGDINGGRGGLKSRLSRNASVVQRKGYTSDDELEEMDSPLVSILDSSQYSSSWINGKHCKQKVTNARYELLREVWSG